MLPSVMQSGHNFSQVPKADIPRSAFDRSHGYKTTFDAGYLIPVYFDEALPGDTHAVQMNAVARLNTPLKPIMDNMFLDTFFFSVPIRLIWSNFERFNGAQDDPADSTDFTIPITTGPSAGAGGIANGSLCDYFGLPTEDAPDLEFNSLFLRGYNLIFNQWFRDQNLEDSVPVPLGDGPDTYSDFVLLRRCKRHDYFTSCLPWPQKGTAVDIPLGTVAPIHSENYYNNVVVAPAANSLPSGSAGDYDFGTTVWADLSAATAATINQLRQAFQVQKLYERDARGGTRYVEILKAHFGVTSPDFRVQRCEYLGGGSSPVIINAIVQNSESGTTPQGNLSAMGTVQVHGHGFNKSFVEHCLIIGLVNVRADLTYQQGLDRMWSRQTRFDMYWPGLAMIGEQAVYNKEIYCVGSAAATDDLVFGYQERFGEYRYKPSKVTGQFRSNYAQSLDIWHLSQEFSALPALDVNFIVENPPVDRVVATPAEPHFTFDAFFKVRSVRPMPMFGVPGLIDHF